MAFSPLFVATHPGSPIAVFRKGVIYAASLAADLSTVGFFAYWCPGVARFRALGQGCGL